MSDNQRWEYSDTFGKTVMQEAIEEARQAANAARQEALAVNSADSS